LNSNTSRSSLAAPATALPNAMLATSPATWRRVFFMTDNMGQGQPRHNDIVRCIADRHGVACDKSHPRQYRGNRRIFLPVGFAAPFAI
jgi:hypothetical protein